VNLRDHFARWCLKTHRVKVEYVKCGLDIPIYYGVIDLGDVACSPAHRQVWVEVDDQDDLHCIVEASHEVAHVLDALALWPEGSVSRLRAAVARSNEERVVWTQLCLLADYDNQEAYDLAAWKFGITHYPPKKEVPE
jgi:hypothetical protein